MSIVGKWLNPDIGGIRPYEPGCPIEEVARRMGMDPEVISKLASNENPLGVSPLALRAMLAKSREMFRYPDGGAYYLCRKLAAHHQVEADRIALGAGSNELLEFIGHCFFAQDRSIVVSAHAFVIYKLVARMFGARIIEVPAKNLGHDLEAMAAAVEPDTCAVFVCNPNNPTGTMVAQPEVEAFLDQISADVLVVFDEAYAEIALAPMPDTLELLGRKPNCLMLRTFSKAYGLAGMRIGYGIGAPEIIAAFNQARQPFNVNRLAQEAALAALDDDDFILRSRALFSESKAYLEEACARLAIEYVPSFANFMLLKTGDGAAVTRRLMEKGVIVRPMDGYGLPDHFRVSYGTMEENRRFIDTLTEVLGLSGKP